MTEIKSEEKKKRHKVFQSNNVSILLETALRYMCIIRHIAVLVLLAELVSVFRICVQILGMHKITLCQSEKYYAHHLHLCSINSGLWASPHKGIILQWSLS